MREGSTELAEVLAVYCQESVEERNRPVRVRCERAGAEPKNLQYGKITKDTKTETENHFHKFSLCDLCVLYVL